MAVKVVTAARLLDGIGESAYSPLPDRRAKVKKHVENPAVLNAGTLANKVDGL
jgi:hypothetical protein